eukprot:TRINITY_DN2366_c1_g1_i1.p1 TRINITY_DN2366_c1_g1~~TRINITY_DN2366_c1_g1_i1.p1  ORF type:complete len:381 (+),score=60.57 TRINITY_DN2366_c1_g1_i1:1302-2444(+)
MSVPPGMMNRKTGPVLINIALLTITGFWIFCGWLLVTCGPRKFFLMAAAWTLGYKTLWRLPSSDEKLTQAESELLQTIQSLGISFEKTTTTISNRRSINAVRFRKEGNPENKQILMCIHGLGAGLGVWVKNVPHLVDMYDIWCVDLLGFGLSSKDKFRGTTPEEAAKWWVSSLKEWHDANIPKGVKVDLLGHSLGGFVAASYAISHPSDIRQLLLAAPVGVISSKETIDRMSKTTRIALRIAFAIGLSRSRMVSLLGPFAHSVIQKVLVRRRRWYGFDEGPLSKYVSHLACAPVTGELPLRCLLHPRRGWVEPLAKQLSHLSTTSKVSIIVGKNDFTSSESLQSQISQYSSSIKTIIVDDVGHHMYATHPEEFTNIILSL